MPPADDPKALQAAWDGGTFPRVVLLAGPDLLTKEEALGRLREKFIGADPGGMSTDVFDGQDASAGAVLTAANTLPFFGGRRLIVVRRANALGTAETNRLADGLTSLPETNCLALLWDERADNRSVLVQAVRSAGTVAVFWPPFENQLPQWITDRARSLGKRMNASAAGALLEAVGPSLPDLVQELKKLALHANDAADITAADVAALSSGGRAGFHYMEWERALWNKDQVRAVNLLEALRSQGEVPETLLPQFIRAVQRLFLGKALFKEGRPKIEVFERLWLKLRDAQRDFETGMAKWGWEELREALERLLAADVAVKTGRSDSDAELTRCVVSLTEEKAAVKRR